MKNVLSLALMFPLVWVLVGCSSVPHSNSLGLFDVSYFPGHLLERANDWQLPLRTYLVNTRECCIAASHSASIQWAWSDNDGQGWTCDEGDGVVEESVYTLLEPRRPLAANKRDTIEFGPDTMKYSFKIILPKEKTLEQWRSCVFDFTFMTSAYDGEYHGIYLKTLLNGKDLILTNSLTK